VLASAYTLAIMLAGEDMMVIKVVADHIEELQPLGDFLSASEWHVI
jgi:hypothetical protein